MTIHGSCDIEYITVEQCSYYNISVEFYHLTAAILS